MSILTKLYNIYDKQQTQIKSNIFSFWKFRTTNPNIPLILKEYNNNDYINIYTKNSNANEDNNNNLYLHTNSSYNSTPALFNHKQLQLQQQQQQRCLIDSNGTNSSSRIESFLQRQENFISAKNKRLENRMKLSEKKLNALYTKIYPTKELGGVEHIAYMMHIMPFLRLIASSGITPDDFVYYLKAGAAAVCLGRTLYNDANTLSDVTKLAKEVKSKLENYLETLPQETI